MKLKNWITIAIVALVTLFNPNFVLAQDSRGLERYNECMKRGQGIGAFNSQAYCESWAPYTPPGGATQSPTVSYAETGAQCNDMTIRCAVGHCIKNSGGTDGICQLVKAPNGEKCYLNTNCQSNYCQGNGGGVNLGICVAYKSPNGEPCYLDDHCQSNYCLANSSGAHEGQCGNRYGNPSGYQCTLDSQCASGRCNGNGIFGGLNGNCR